MLSSSGKRSGFLSHTFPAGSGGQTLSRTTSLKKEPCRPSPDFLIRPPMMKNTARQGEYRTENATCPDPQPEDPDEEHRKPGREQKHRPGSSGSCCNCYGTEEDRTAISTRVMRISEGCLPGYRAREIVGCSDRSHRTRAPDGYVREREDDTTYNTTPARWRTTIIITPTSPPIAETRTVIPSIGRSEAPARLMT